MIDVSILLATYNRADFLESCIDSLCRQTLDPARYEICVINNACTDNTSEIVARMASRFPHHRLFEVFEPTPGLSRARNCGMRHTTAPLVAHVDDDGTVYPDWLERFMSHFAMLPDALAAVCGGIEPVWGAPPPQWLTDKMKCFLSADSGLGDVPRFLGPEEFICEGNSCFRRDVLEQAGKFPEDLGRAGNNLLSGENVVVNVIRQLGYTFYYDPAASLRHYIHANRLTPEWFRQRFFWQGVSGYRQYQMRLSGPATETAYMQLPLDAQDWDFAHADKAETIGDSLFKFQCLGFTLALGGLIAAGD